MRRRDFVRDAFTQALAEFGFVLGRDVVEERRGAHGHTDRLRLLAAELVRLHVDAIVAIGNLATHAARDATRTIPIVMAYVSDAERDGLIERLARPGGNVTGLANLEGLELGAKYLELTKELLPRVSRVVIIANRESANSRRTVERLRAVVRPLDLILMEVGDRNDFEKSFGAIRAARPDALWFWTTAIGIADFPQTVQLALRHHLPCIMGSRRAVEAGALLSYAEDNVIVWRRVGRYVGKILRGAKPAELPVNL